MTDFEPVQITDMRMVAKAAIVVYREIATGRLFIDPALPENPLFRLGDVKGDTGAAGVAGAAGLQGIQGVKGDTGAAGINARMPVVLAGAMLNSARTGVVNGLDIQSVDSAVALIGRVVVFRGLLKLLSTATGNGSMQANIGGMIYTFPTLAITVSTQYLSYEVTVHLLISGVGFAFVRQSIALNGIAANAVQSNKMTQSGTSSSNTALIQFKSPTTTQVSTLFAVTETL